MQSREQVSSINRSPTGEWIPSLGGVETVLAASLASFITSAAVVFTRGDIVEGRGGGGVSGESVEGGVKETESSLSGGETSVVDERDDTSDGWGGARGSRDLVELSSDADVVVVSEEGDVRVSTSSVVVHAAWWELNTRAEVVGDSGALVAGLREDSRESSTCVCLSDQLNGQVKLVVQRSKRIEATKNEDTIRD